MPETTKSKKRARHEAWLAARIDTLLLLRQRFPLAFARLNASERRPLKVGIHAEIAATLPDLGAVTISRALHFYCRDARYRAACIEGAARVDLAGSPAGVVTAAEARHANLSKAERRERRPAAASPPPLPPPPSPPKRLSLSDLRAAATARKLLVQGA